MPRSSPAPLHPLLWWFAAANLLLGSGAFVLGGILDAVATDLQVPVGAVGQNMTAYALSTALLVPLLMVLTGRWSRRSAVLAALLLFTLGTLVCAAAPNLTVLLAGRVLMGAGALFTPLAAGMTVALSEPAQRGKALSLTFLGMSMSYVVGVPLGAWLGLQFGWRWPLLLIAAATLVLAVVLYRRMPPQLEAPGARFQGLGTLLARGDVVRPLLLTLLYFVAISAVFSYIGPVLRALEPMDATQLSWTLAIFGVSGVIGTLSGGWANDRFGALAALRVQVTGLLLMMCLVPLTAGHYVAVLTVLVLWGVFGFGMMTPQQSRLADASPPHAPMLLSLNASMLYLGTALGAAVGGAGSPWLGFARLPWLGAAFAALGLLVLLTSPASVPTSPTRHAP